MDKKTAKKFLNNKEWLYEQYVTKQRTIDKIAEFLDYGRNAIAKKIKDFNLPKQTRSELARRIILSDETISKLDNKNLLFDLHIIQDWSLDKIAEDFGVTKITIKKQMEKFNITYEDGRARRLTDESRIKLSNRDWLYNQHIVNKRSQSSIAKELKVDINTIKRRLLSFDIKPLSLTDIHRSHMTPENIALIENKDWLYEQYYVKNLSLMAIGKQLNTSKEFVKKQLNRFGIALISHKNQVQKHMPEGTSEKLDDMEWLINQYCVENLSLSDIGTLLGVSRGIVKLRLIDLGIEIRDAITENQSHIDKKSLELLNNGEWLKKQHHNEKLNILQIADNLKVSSKTVTRSLQKFDIPIITHSSSAPEKELIDFIKAYYMDCVTNTRKIIPPYELDAFVPSLNIAFEFNGLYWHSDAKKDMYYHKRKYDLAKSKGIRLIQIFEDDWTKNKNLVKSKILYILNKSLDNKIYARKTNIIHANTTIKKNFFNKFHIQGDGSSSINYSLEHENNIIACIGFIKNADGSYTLNRYATSCNVIGGFTKLLTHFEREFNYPKIITFADLTWSDGDLYFKSGFILDKKLEPDYAWIVKYDGVNYERQHKFNFRHKYLKNKLKNYDPSLTEVQNMHNHGYNRIYDAGKLRFVKNV